LRLCYSVLQHLKIFAARNEVVGRAILPAAGFQAGSGFGCGSGYSMAQTIVFCRLLVRPPQIRQPTNGDGLSNKKT
jgi:hypothetical protein